jgi:WhiB family transcriptional regulator, redox-sensing transcriptional regulator
MLASERNWRLLAACRFADPDLFFPISTAGASSAQVAAAKAVCGECAVRRECLAFALATRQVYGVWGGMSEEERRQSGSSVTALVRPVSLVRRAGRGFGSC